MEIVKGTFTVRLRPSRDGMNHPTGSMQRGGITATYQRQEIVDPPKLAFDEPWFEWRAVKEPEPPAPTVSAAAPPPPIGPIGPIGPIPAPKKRGRPRKSKSRSS